MIEQLPGVRIVTVATLTVQTDSVFDANVTVRLEVAVALMVNDATPMVTLLSGAKEMVCVCRTVKDWGTGVAAAKVPLPAWLAVIEHVPAVRIVTVATLTVQTASVFDAKLTVRPELDVALIPNGITPRVWLLSGPNVIVCDTTT